jgi:hypothetical protein
MNANLKKSRPEVANWDDVSEFISPFVPGLIYSKTALLRFAFIRVNPRPNVRCASAMFQSDHDPKLEPQP